MVIEKGGLAYYQASWYIIVAIHYKNGKVGIDCLCDNANNIYYLDTCEIEYFASLKEIHAYSFGNSSEKFKDLVNSRQIPFEVITAVLSGYENDRFAHWHEQEEP